MKKYIHINQHKIKSNHKNNKREPVITVKTYNSNSYGHQVHILGECKVVYSPDKPLSCGAKVWIETEAEVITIPDFVSRVRPPIEPKEDNYDKKSLKEAIKKGHDWW
tara:strand:- start:232 stop:552 length:321 start_codon:yes stop_codon:yes gene_type:complete